MTNAETSIQPESQELKEMKKDLMVYQCHRDILLMKGTIRLLAEKMGVELSDFSTRHITSHLDFMDGFKLEILESVLEQLATEILDSMGGDAQMLGVLVDDSTKN